MKNNNRSGALLAELIDRKGETQAQFADAMGIAPSQVSQWISGYRNPFSNRSTITKIAEHFNVSADYLLGITESATSDEELNEILLELKNRPELRMLFKTTRGTSRADIERTMAIVEGLKKQSEKNNG